MTPSKLLIELLSWLTEMMIYSGMKCLFQECRPNIYWIHLFDQNYQKFQHATYVLPAHEKFFTLHVASAWQDIDMWVSPFSKRYPGSHVILARDLNVVPLWMILPWGIVATIGHTIARNDKRQQFTQYIEVASTPSMILSRVSGVGSPTNHPGSWQWQDTGPGIIRSVHRWTEQFTYVKSLDKANL